jgi:ABC-type transport system involved in multi-copper enzyme maturation permease subunit
MIPMLLIAGNFVRENRWPMVSLLAYVLLFGGVTVFSSSNPDDVVFFLRSVGVYGLAFTALMSASGIHNERRSRRLLAVLSKGIERWQYLCGLLLGAMFDAAIYSVAVAALGSFAPRNIEVATVRELVVALLVSFFLAGTVALFFSTFLHPVMSVLATALTLGVMAAAGRVVENIFPSYALAQAMLGFGVEGWTVPWGACAWAVLWAAMFAAMAAVVFARRDIAVAVE